MQLSQYPTYDSYKDSGVPWIGDLPSNWKVERGKWLFNKAERPVEQDDEIVTCFRDGMVTLRRNRRLDGFTNAIQEHGYQGIRKGDLVIHAMDAFAGAIGVSDSDGKSTPVYSACIERVPNTVDPNFYAYYLRHLALTGLILSLAKGIRERSTDFRFGDFAQLEMAAPSLHEQRTIAAFLDEKTAKIDQAIRIKEQQIALLKERKQIVVQTAVTKGLNPNTPMKDSGIDWIGQIPERWEVMRIKQVTSKIGSGITPSGGASVYVDDGIPLLRSQNIHLGRIDLYEVARISASTHRKMLNSQVKYGDVLLNITGGSIGRSHFFEDSTEANVNQHVCILRHNSMIFHKFLNLLLTSEIGQHQIWLFQQGGGREGLNFTALGNFLLPVPQLDEQMMIVRSVEQQIVVIDSGIANKQRQISALKEYKTSLINAAVTGKIKVT